MANPIDALYSWFTDKDWRTWLSHGLVMLGALVGARYYGELGAGLGVFAFYVLREAGDIKRDGFKTDNIGDLLAPALVLLIWLKLL